VTEISDQTLMQLAAKISHGAVRPRQNNWSLVVRNLTLRLRVDTNQVQVVPNLGHKLVEVPFIFG